MRGEMERRKQSRRQWEQELRGLQEWERNLDPVQFSRSFRHVARKGIDGPPSVPDAAHLIRLVLGGMLLPFSMTAFVPHGVFRVSAIVVGLELAEIYRRALGGACVELQEGSGSCERVDHIFVVYVNNRDAVRATLEARGVQTGIHYPSPLHLQKSYQALGYRQGDYPHAERACQRVISMPLYPEMTNEQAAYAAQTLREVVGEK